MKSCVYIGAALAALSATHSAQAMDGMNMGGNHQTGGWTKAKATHELKDKLVAALTKGNDNYANGVATRLCVTQLKFVDQQVVAGTNYRFHIMGCDVGSAFERVGKCGGADANCKPSSYAVQVFEQPWTDTLQVTKITVESGPALMEESAKLSDEEMRMIDVWLKQNKLNRFGDKKGTSYTGGTPLFDETTGTQTDRIAYIISHHSDRPWLPTEAPMPGMVRAVPMGLSAKEQEKAAKKSVANETYMKGLAAFGAFAMAIGAIAFVKARQTSTRRFNYDTVSRSEL